MSTKEQVSLCPLLSAHILPVFCRCPADCAQHSPCGAPPPAHRCVAYTQCCAPPGGALVYAGLLDLPASSCMSPPVLQAGSPCQMSVWGGGGQSQGGVDIHTIHPLWYIHNKWGTLTILVSQLSLTSETLWRKPIPMHEINSINTDVRVKSWMDVCVWAVWELFLRV